MKRKFLEDLGLEKDVIEKIMNENGADIEKAKGEVETLRNQLNETQDKLKSFEGVQPTRLNMKRVLQTEILMIWLRVLLANTRPETLRQSCRFLMWKLLSPARIRTRT